MLLKQPILDLHTPTKKKSQEQVVLIFMPAVVGGQEPINKGSDF